MHCIIRGKFVISPCRKSALFWIHAVILLFHAEILPCGPPLGPHSCAEPFLGVMQKYSFLGDIYTSAIDWTEAARIFIWMHLKLMLLRAWLNEIRKHETSNPFCSGHPKVQSAWTARRHGQKRQHGRVRGQGGRRYLSKKSLVQNARQASNPEWREGKVRNQEQGRVRSKMLACS